VPDYSVLDPGEQVRLLNSVKNMTESGTITWRDPNEDDPNFHRKDWFIAALPGGKFAFGLESVDGDGVAPYMLTVHQYVEKKDAENGIKVIASIQMEPADKGGNAAINELIERLYADVARRARRSDTAIEELFSAIDQAEQKPPF
jgi:hypothetical protein